MRRTTIVADPAVLTELEYIAREKKTSLANVIREAMSRYVAKERPPKRKLPDFVGMFDGPPDNVAERADEILRTEWVAELEREIREGTEDLMRRPGAREKSEE